MRKLYQTSWHDISFQSFGKLSTAHLPDAAFYSNFYQIFNRKYRSVDDLDKEWVCLKRKTADFIIANSRINREGRTLSIGCGLGLIELSLIESGFSALEVTEVSEVPLRWLLPAINREKVHIGFFPDCISHQHKYDFIVLASVEYFLDNFELTNLIRSVHDRLLPGGICLLVSWSFHNMNKIETLTSVGKEVVKFLLEKVRIRTRGQFWGYIRESKEFRHAMRSCGLTSIRDGTLDTGTRWDTYWLEAVKNV